jgi:serine/threonine protein kinase
MQAAGNRRFVLKAALGEGGFGTVYLATMEGGQGFTKDVAIKVLRDASPPVEVLQRFRDEARVLGLLRDRAIVSVDPPTQIDGKWAVVMEYVEGESASALLKKHGAYPTGVALEIVSEVARALHKAWHAVGPDGRELQLIHRDLKPSNLQITRSGEVKILDFGLAKAAFDTREAETRDGISGTLGYIAPERFEGVESAATDVYSLGVILQQMLLARRLGNTEAIPSFVPNSVKQRAMDLAEQMRHPSAPERPTAREVERLCRTLLKGGELEGLRDWAERLIPVREIDGPVLDHVLADGDPASVTSLTVQRAALAAGGTSVVLMGGLTTVAVLLCAGGLWWNSAQAPEPVGGESPLVVHSQLVPEPVEPAVRSTPVLELTPPAPGGVVVPAPRRPEPRPVEGPQDQPVPEPVREPIAEPEPRPVRSPDATRYHLTLVSIPPDASVTVDGRAVGKTNLGDVPVSAGSHVIQMTRGDATIRRSVQVGKRAPTRYIWRVKTNDWKGAF